MIYIFLTHTHTHTHIHTHTHTQIMDHGAPVDWDDIAGLEFAKASIKEIVVWPMLRP